MRQLFFRTNVVGLILFVVVFGIADIAAQKPALKRKAVVKKVIKPAEPVYTVDAGTVFRVRMNRTLTSKTARVGETFTVTVTEPVYSSNGVVVVPTGSTLLGRVDVVKLAAKGGRVGELDAHFIQVRLPNGRTRSINGLLTDLDAGKTMSDNEGTAAGDKMKHRKVIFIGGGAVGGTILGAAIGGGKGALIGGLIGAGAGFLGDRYTKGAEAEVKSGTEFGVYLSQAISLPRFVEVTS